MSKIKIVHLVSDLNIGGVQNVVYNICKSADLEKYDVIIFALNPGTEILKADPLPDSIKIFSFNYYYSPSYSLLSYVKHAFFSFHIQKKTVQIITEFRKINADILHVHIHPRELQLALLMKGKSSCHLLYTEHVYRFTGNNIKHKLYVQAIKYLLRKFHLTAVSLPIDDFIKQNRLVAKDKIYALIKNSIPVPANRFGLARENRVLYVARIGNPKAHDILLQAWKKSKKAKASELLLVGPDEMNGKMQDLCKELSLTNVRFTGSVNNVYELLSTCSVGVFPSYQEGLPIALIEKMSAGLPVIVSDIPELTAIITHNDNGLVFKRGDVSDLAEKLDLLLNDAALQKKLGEKARADFLLFYANEKIASDYEVVYNKILNLK